jgi:hypothetical protein
MNERIRELAVQAGATLEKGYIELSDGQLMLSDNVELDKSNMDLEKFAELIVRECALTAGLMEHEGRKGIGAQILDNFGVEL